MADGREALEASVSVFGRQVNGWMITTDTIGVYGNAYLRRAGVTLVGLGANPPEDAIYPLLATHADGDPLFGEQDYVIHFAADELPPAAAFWSITMYDAEGYQVANELDRFAIGDRDALSFNADSPDIFISHTNPGHEREPNWLPAPQQIMGVTMRLDETRPSLKALDGRGARRRPARPGRTTSLSAPARPRFVRSRGLVGLSERSARRQIVGPGRFIACRRGRCCATPDPRLLQPHAAGS